MTPCRRRLARFLAALGIALPSVLATGEAAAQAGSMPIAPTLLARIFPDGGRLDPFDGNPPAAALRDSAGRVLGYAFFSRDIVGSVGYSGKPINVFIGLDVDGRIAGAELVEHHEPILILGIPDDRLRKFVADHRGWDIRPQAVVPEGLTVRSQAIAGATVSSMVLRDSILRSARAVARARGILKAEGAGPVVDLESYQPIDWDGLIAEGSVARLRATAGQLPDARPVSSVGDDAVLIDLYSALLTPPSIGRNVLGDAEHNRTLVALREGDHVILIAANGLLSFKGTTFSRTGFFDRIQLIQGERTIRFETRFHRRLDRLLGRGVPEFREIGLFTVPAELGFDPSLPWRIELLLSGGEATGRRLITLASD
jgi:NosR/NirI family nitrous oxide reductase transcriptional regulator